MPATFRIHPAIGIARVGNSTSSFYIAPEQRGALPIECNEAGVPNGQPVQQFKDRQGRIRRQAARFRVYVYDDGSPAGRELHVGESIDIEVERSGKLTTVRVDDVRWTVYLANKKSSWYEFRQLEGEHGYTPDHPLRNADLTNPEERQKLIIDPGARSVSSADGKQSASFAPSDAGADTFPPPLVPHSIRTLGDLLCVEQDGTNRLLVLGGLGDSGSVKTGFGNPKIEDYANNDGWFDDTSDGSVRATLLCTPTKIDGHPAPAGMRQLKLDVDDPAWVIVGYPRYAPELTDVVTMDDVVFDLAVRHFAFAPYMYGIAPFNGGAHRPVYADDPDGWRDQAAWNVDYRPYFERDIWPILIRPQVAGFVMDFDPVVGANPHVNEPHGNFFEADLRVPPDQTPDPEVRTRRDAMRQFIYAVLRKAGRENELVPEPHSGKQLLYAMPLLCGDNPLTNTVPSKFLRLTDTMLFMLRQWADGRFIDEKSELIDPASIAPSEAVALDRGVLANLLGGSFCPGGEASWIMRNPAIYSGPYRLAQVAKPVPGALTQPAVVPVTNDALAPTSLGAGLEPGDITKYSGVPWQADFNECTDNATDVTFRDWNVLYPASTGDPIAQTQQLTYWWPAHRPVTVSLATGGQFQWSGTDATNRGDLEMVTLWATRKFLIGADANDITQGIV
ncbi:MAG: LodA/GoxA family CTQ-dependent oxidase, partial [Candidatus Eremiobacteraeota bacterium]|nr:LodA/GoxA family CTQ-dependent oxidase [Candidatus Eremiobacteraeota bacterium]